MGYPAVSHQSPTAEARTNDTTGKDDKKRKPAAKLERYAGQTTSVESFIFQFESHAKYFQWTEQDRVFQLKNSLTGIAAQALWTGGEHSTSAELIQILHSGHGGKLQTKRFWSELRARRRRKDEPLQEVCQDVRRLMYLASPDETSPLAEHISIDLYVAAIADPNMRMFVMSKDPKTLEDALTHSIRNKPLLLGSTEPTQPAVLDPASYVYNDRVGKRRASEQWRYTRTQRSTTWKHRKRSTQKTKGDWPTNNNSWTRVRRGTSK